MPLSMNASAYEFGYERAETYVELAGTFYRCGKETHCLLCA